MSFVLLESFNWWAREKLRINLNNLFICNSVKLVHRLCIRLESSAVEASDQLVGKRFRFLVFKSTFSLISCDFLPLGSRKTLERLEFYWENVYNFVQIRFDLYSAFPYNQFEILMNGQTLNWLIKYNVNDVDRLKPY